MKVENFKPTQYETTVSDAMRRDETRNSQFSSRLNFSKKKNLCHIFGKLEVNLLELL